MPASSELLKCPHQPVTIHPHAEYGAGEGLNSGDDFSFFVNASGSLEE